MSTTEILVAACDLLPREASATGGTTADVRAYLDHDEWEVALELLAELAGTHPMPVAFWELLLTAARQLRLGRAAAWCRWRAAESHTGILRCELALVPNARRSPIPGAGTLRPFWDVGSHDPNHARALRIAALWVEDVPELAPGGTATVRLLPLEPSGWSHLVVGDTIAMHEARPVAGTAVILEMHGPQPVISHS
ncbi:hypothetical protein JK358_19895 [Nocardia sp. 2]|uniref:Uncharacterized protein n=1 Tax=Nocardia acididurans TaxID=2802282 RepID=A0ABS1M9F3_9NOCA|nr:hypothetical protein [Nocardia acididurans]MBL1076665.1 hypothetical protein [Nocardia acididurans]